MSTISRRTQLLYVLRSLKMLSVIAIMVALCIAVIWVQRTLNHTILDKSAPKDLLCFVSREVADRTTSSDRAIHPGDKESCVGEVFFTGIEGFITLSKKIDP